ncbi:hypothetical protein [Spiroplasma clarkii]|uniref:hypothetical protein n=1 Tax=Spiroplasma clarkii TaxID=2139 RepID=UPI0011BAB1F8|nr:hypothetical protein [Spiroplasma clarkii]
MLGLIVVLLLAVTSMTANYVVKAALPHNSALVTWTTWISLAFTILTYLYFLSYMLKLNNRVWFQQKVYKNIDEDDLINNKKIFSRSFFQKRKIKKLDNISFS